MKNKKQALLSKQLLKSALITSTITGLVLSSVNVLAQTGTASSNVLNKPAYTLKIVTHGEG